MSKNANLLECHICLGSGNALRPIDGGMAELKQCWLCRGTGTITASARHKAHRCEVCGVTSLLPGTCKVCYAALAFDSSGLVLKEKREAVARSIVEDLLRIERETR